MFGPGVSTMPNETRAKPSRAGRWGMARLAGDCCAFYRASRSDAISKIAWVLVEYFSDDGVLPRPALLSAEARLRAKADAGRGLGGFYPQIPKTKCAR